MRRTNRWQRGHRIVRSKTQQTDGNQISGLSQMKTGGPDTGFSDKTIHVNPATKVKMAGMTISFRIRNRTLARFSKSWSTSNPSSCR